MSLKERLEQRVLSFVVGIAVATLSLYLVLIQLLGLSVVRRDDYMLRSDVAENFVMKDKVAKETPCTQGQPREHTEKLEGGPASLPAEVRPVSPPAEIEKEPASATAPGDVSVSLPKASRHIEPVSGAGNDYGLTIERCSRGGEVIECIGLATNKTDAPTSLLLSECRGADDEGNSFDVYPSIAFGRMGFDNGSREKLIPSVPVRFYIKIPDAHASARKLSFIVRTEWQGNSDELVFKDLPVD